MIRVRLFMALVAAAAAVGGVWIAYGLSGGRGPALALVFTSIGAVVCGAAVASGQRRRVCR